MCALELMWIQRIDLLWLDVPCTENTSHDKNEKAEFLCVKTEFGREQLTAIYPENANFSDVLHNKSSIQTQLTIEE